MRTTAPSGFWIPALVILFTVAVYLPALENQFVVDDSDQIYYNQSRLNLQSIPQYFASDVWSYLTAQHSNYYRPFFLVWLMINYQLLGLSPVLWHASAILVHVAATLLVYLLARRLLDDRMLAGLAALLFGVHPAHVESVAWVSGATEPLFAVPLLACLLLHMKARDGSGTARARWWRAGALLCAAAAIFSKETAAIVPVAVFACEWFFSTAASRAVRLRTAANAALPYLIPVAAYLPMRWHALRSFAPMPYHWRFWSCIQTFPLTLVFYLRHLLWPFPNSLFYPLEPVEGWSFRQLALPLAALGAAGLGLYRLARGDGRRLFSVVLIILPILPVLDVHAFPKENFVHDRYLYLPVAGLCLLAVLALRQFRRGTAILLAAGVVMGACTLRAGAIWRDEMALYRQAFAVAPDSPFSLESYGTELARHGQCAEGLVLMKRALAARLADEALYLNIAKCYKLLGEYDQAANYLHDLMVISPNSPAAFSVMAIFELSRNHLDAAETAIRRALQLRPANGAPLPGYHMTLGLVLEGKGDWNHALAEYETEIRENPGATDAVDRAAALRARIGH
jgi:tetratricopeptide (TPR) repeat protein